MGSLYTFCFWGLTYSLTSGYAAIATSAILKLIGSKGTWYTFCFWGFSTSGYAAMAASPILKLIAGKGIYFWDFSLGAADLVLTCDSFLKGATFFAATSSLNGVVWAPWLVVITLGISFVSNLNFLVITSLTVYVSWVHICTFCIGKSYAGAGIISRFKSYAGALETLTFRFMLP